MTALRPRKPKEVIPKPKASLTTAERAQRFRDCLHQDAAKWEEYLKSERERKRNERRNRTEEQKQIDREKSRLRQREYKKRQKEKGIKPKPKENKVLTRSQKGEQRAYWRERQKICRSKKSSQKKRRIKEHDRNYRRDERTKDSSTQADEFHESDDKSTTTLSCYSKEAVRKSASRCNLPSHAEKFAETLNYIVEKATPTKKEALKRKGIICSPNKKKENQCREKMIEYFKDKIKAKKSDKRKYLAAMKVMKKYKLSRRTSLLLDVQPSDISRCREDDAIRATRSDALGSDVKKKLDFFFNQPNVSTTLPDQKSILKDGKEKKVLNRPLVDFYKDFKVDNPDVEIAFSTFAANRPSNIGTSKKQQWYSCLCECCTNVDLKLRSINAFATKVKKPEMKIRDKYEAVCITLCNKGENQFHKLKCINRECNDCQTDLLMAHLQPLLQDYGNQIVDFTRWETTKMRNKHGKDVSRVMMVKHSKSLQDMVLETMTELSKLSRHLFNARWQQLQFSTIIKDIPKNWVILNLDFAENYACVSQMEIQTAHWYHQQVTIHPIVAYYNCQQCQETVQETILFISDDLTHDAHAVHKFISMTNEHLQQKRMINIQHEIQFSDGCSSQYKSFTPLCDISYALEDYSFIIERHFYGSRHGKGPCDGAGAVLKSAARRAVMGHTQVFNNSKDLFEFAKLKLVKDDLPNSDEHLHSKRTVFHVTESDICRNRPDRIAKTLKGTRLLHSIKTKEGMNIYTRTQSCFCQPCREGIGQCQNDEYVENWKEEHLYRRGENRPRVRQIGNVGEVQRGERGRTRYRGRQRGLQGDKRGNSTRRGHNDGTRVQIGTRGPRTRGGQVGTRGQVDIRRGQVGTRGPRTRGGQVGTRGQVDIRRGQAGSRRPKTRGGQVGTRGQVDIRRGQVGTRGKTQGQRGSKRGRRDDYSSDSSEVSEKMDCSFDISDVSEQEDSEPDEQEGSEPDEQEDSEPDSEPFRSCDVSSLGIEIPSFDDGDDQGYSIDLSNIIYSLLDEGTTDVCVHLPYEGTRLPDEGTTDDADLPDEGTRLPTEWTTDDVDLSAQDKNTMWIETPMNAHLTDQGATDDVDLPNEGTTDDVYLPDEGTRLPAEGTRLPAEGTTDDADLPDEGTRLPAEGTTDDIDLSAQDENKVWIDTAMNAQLPDEGTTDYVDLPDEGTRLPDEGTTDDIDLSAQDENKVWIDTAMNAQLPNEGTIDYVDLPDEVTTDATDLPDEGIRLPDKRTTDDVDLSAQDENTMWIDTPMNAHLPDEGTTYYVDLPDDGTRLPDEGTTDDVDLPDEGTADDVDLPDEGTRLPDEGTTDDVDLSAQDENTISQKYIMTATGGAIFTKNPGGNGATRQRTFWFQKWTLSDVLNHQI